MCIRDSNKVAGPKGLKGNQRRALVVHATLVECDKAWDDLGESLDDLLPVLPLGNVVKVFRDAYWGDKNDPEGHLRRKLQHVARLLEHDEDLRTNRQLHQWIRGCTDEQLGPAKDELQVLAPMCLGTHECGWGQVGSLFFAGAALSKLDKPQM